MVYFSCISEERRPTVNELSNQKGVNQKASGWKLFHIAAQIEDLVRWLFQDSTVIPILCSEPTMLLKNISSSLMISAFLKESARYYDYDQCLHREKGGGERGGGGGGLCKLIIKSLRFIFQLLLVCLWVTYTIQINYLCTVDLVNLPCTIFDYRAFIRIFRNLNLPICFFQVDIEKGMLSHMSGIQKSIAPKGFVKETMEDDIGMVHEITQVRKMNIKS